MADSPVEFRSHAVQLVSCHVFIYARQNKTQEQGMLPSGAGRVNMVESGIKRDSLEAKQFVPGAKRLSIQHVHILFTCHRLNLHVLLILVSLNLYLCKNLPRKYKGKANNAVGKSIEVRNSVSLIDYRESQN